MDSLREAAACDELGASLLGKIVVAAQDISSVRLFCTQHFDSYKLLLPKLVVLLNSNTVLKTKTAALATLASLARYKAGRDEMYNVIKTIDMSFENTLKEKEDAAASLGTSLGKLHSTMLVLMMRVFGYRIRGAEVVEYASSKPSLAVDLLLEICKVPSYEPEVVANCCSALMDLSTRSPDGETQEPVEDFMRRVDVLLHLVEKYGAVAAMSTAVQRHLKAAGASAPRAVMCNAIHTAVVSLVTAIFNFYMFTSEGTSATNLRQSLLVSTDLLTACIPTYVRLCLDEVSRCIDHSKGVEVHPISPVLGIGITHSLRLLAFGSFHMGSRSLSLRVANVATCALLGLPLKAFVLKHLELYAYLLHYNVNIDSLAGEHCLPQDVSIPDLCRSASILRVASQVLAAIPSDKASELWRLIANGSKHVPIAKDATSFDLLGNLFDISINEERLASPPNSITVNVFSDDITSALDERMASLEADPEITTLRQELKEPDSKDLRLLGDLPSLLAKPLPKQSIAQTEQIAAKPKKPIDLPKKAQEIWVDAAGSEPQHVPQEFTCSINGHLLRHPLRAPSGHVFEKETIELWMKQVGSTDPITGGDLPPEELRPDTELMARILEWQIGQNSSINKVDEDNLYQF